MKKIRKKLESLQKNLPVDLQKFITDIKLPEDENCFEFSYFKTFTNILSLFAEEGAETQIVSNKETGHYRVMMKNTITLSNPKNEKDTFDVTIQVFVNGVGDHRFAKISYDKEVFFIDRTDGSLLVAPALV